jgi:FtsP/CotA-like multicopper oxidase with cupredoxin domain
MAGRLLSAGVLLLLSGLSLAAPAADPQSQINTATVNTTDNTPVTTAFTTQNTPAPTSYGGADATLYHSPALLLKGSDLNPFLPQSTTNGKSILGLLGAPRLPPWLSGPLAGGLTPWGSRTTGNTNPYTNTPNTGVTRSYTFHISTGTIAPDGVEVEGLLVNGAFPGPTIEANWGDWFQITVYNDLTTEGTTLHW